MPSEDNASKTSEEPGTPELTPTTGDNSVSAGQRKLILPPTAPKGKPKAPPLIRGKIRPNESDGDMSSVNGSKIPLLKTKHLETDDNPSEGRKHGSSTFSGNHSGKSGKMETKLAKSSKSTMDVHRTVEKIRLPKGIEMVRVVQESNGIKPKKYSSAIKVGATTSTKESSQGSSNGTHRRKMTKVEASFPEVKSFTGHLHPTGSGSSLTSKSKSNEDGKNMLPDNSKKTSQEKLPEASSSKTTQNEVTVPTTEISKPEETPAEVDYKTIDEFLKMPETSIPETKLRSPMKKTIYKSKFWEYIEPKNSTKSKRSAKEIKKNYDPDAVKTFMQKQKEMRRIQQMEEAKKKEEQVAKRQQMLKELDSKCHKIALKGKQRSSGGEDAEESPMLNVGEDAAKKPKLEIQSQSPSLKYLKPLLDRKQGSLLRKSDGYTRDVAKQSQYLLTEFENIVKRECISFLQKIPVPPSRDKADGPNTIIEKVDKAVGTSVSLLDLNLNSVDSEQRKQSQSGDDDLMEIESLEYDSKDAKVPSPSTVVKSATKIQALYRGYKVRQALRDANIFYRKPICKKRSSEVLHQNTTNNESNQQTNSNRRWSFPRMPEKPYDNLSRLLPMSPIPMARVSLNSSIPCYIPPPSAATGQTPRSPSRPRVLPSFPLTPNRMYNEPYPKQQIRKSLENLERVKADVNLPSTVQPQESFQCIHTRKNTTMGSSTIGLSNFQNPAPMNMGPRDFDFAIPSSIPSIVDVLREKIRLFSNEKNNGLPLSRVSELKDKDTGKDFIELMKEKSQVSVATNDDQTTTPDHADGVTPKVKKHKRRSRPKSQRSPVGDSTTTVDTDVEYASRPNATRSSMSVSERQKQANNHSSSTNVSKSEETIRSSSLDNPTTTSSFDNFLAPALQLRYEAEREHLKIIEKALQVRLQGNNNEQNQQSVVNQEGSSKKSSPETDRVQLAIANCQKESLKAAAEMTKWLSEFQKTTREQERAQEQQTPVNLAATVIAAVEQARIIGVEKRREKKLQEQQNKQKILEHQLHVNVQTHMTSESESQSSEIVKRTADKSVETSLILVKNFKNDLVDKEQKRSCVENAAGVIRSLKDYQQQFPSESERDSPIPVVPAAQIITAHESHAITNFITAVSRQSTPEDIDMAFKFQEPIDYPSIIPSGNSVDFSSLDPRVSTLDYVSQISSEKEFPKDMSENDSKDLKDEGDSEFSSLKKLSPKPSVAEIVSVQTESEVFTDGISLHSTVVDEATSSEQSNFIADVSSVPSKIEEVISEHSIVEDVSLQSKMVVEEAVSIDSRIDDIVSEQSKLIITEASLEDIAEETTEKGTVDTDRDISENDNKDEELDSLKKLSPDPSVVEMVSVQSGIKISNDGISLHSTVVDEAALSEQSNFIADISSAPSSKISEVISEHSPLEEKDVSLQSKMDAEVVQSDSKEAVSIDSKIDDFVSEQSKLVNEVSVVEEDISEENGNSEINDKENGNNNIKDEENEDFVSIQKISPEPGDAEIVSERTGSEKFNDGISLHSTLVDDAGPTEQSKIEEVTSEHSLVEEKDVSLQSKIILEADQSESKEEAISTESKIEDIVSEPSKIINEVSQDDIVEDIVNSTIEENASVHSKSVDVISEQLEFEEDIPQESVIEEDNDPSNKAEIPETEVIDTDDKRDTEAEQQLPPDALSKPDFEIPLKPPPPYSPSSSLESTSLSSRSLIVSLPGDKLKQIAAKQADIIWDTWKSGEGEPDSFPEKSIIMKALYDQNLVKAPFETDDTNSNGNLQAAAEHNFDVLLCHLIYETTKEMLQVSNNFTSLIERVRPGPLSLHAQKLKIPKTKDALVATVIARVMKIIPPAFFSDPHMSERDKPRIRKWCSRPRELVDEILLEELVEEDYQWTEWWPEEVIISHHISTKIIQNLVRSALQKRRYVHSQ